MAGGDPVPIVAFLTSPTVGFLLKLCSGIAAAGFGILGIGATTRSETGALTTKGKIALTGIVLAGVLAIGTSVFDFVSAESVERATRQRAERLLVSVQRGVYPMRGVRASLNVAITGKFEALTSYLTALKKTVAEDRQCKKHPQSQIACSGIDLSTNEILIYSIPKGSPFFPSADSSLGKALNFIEVHVGMYKGSVDRGKATYLGRFFVEWWPEGLPKTAKLNYDFKRGTLSLEIEDMPVDDKTVASGGVYSLIDFLPGFLWARPTVADDPLCLTRKTLDICRDEDLTQFVDGLVLERFELAFEYPKRIQLFWSEYTTCKADRTGPPGWSQPSPMTSNLSTPWAT